MALAPFRRDPKWQAEGIEDAIQRGIDWLVAMQCKDGGWGAFDKDNDKKILTKIPFCDFGEALDPPSADVTAHIIEAFAKVGLDRNHPVDRPRAGLSEARAGAGRPVVRPLGRQLRLRHRRGAAGAGRDRRGHEPALYRARLRLADRAAAGQWRLGRKLRLLHGRQAGRPGHRHRVADRLGADGADRRQPRRRTATPSSAAACIWPRRSATAPGSRRTTPAPASPATASARPSS